ncbi:MAG: hypothetical protein V4653_01015, partial [Pseudomonadota bacterium]
MDAGAAGGATGALVCAKALPAKAKVASTAIPTDALFADLALCHSRRDSDANYSELARAHGTLASHPGDCESCAMGSNALTADHGVRAAPVAASLLAHLRRCFVRAIGKDGALQHGIAEHAGDPAAAAFETAIAAEALAHPVLRREDPRLAAELAECLLAMEADGDLARAIGRPPLATRL